MQCFQPGQILSAEDFAEDMYRNNEPFMAGLNKFTVRSQSAPERQTCR